MIITKKQFKKQQKITYGVMGATGLMGATGTTVGIIALVKANKVKADVDNFHTDMERRITAEEGMSRQFSKAVSQIQDVLEENGMLRVKK